MKCRECKFIESVEETSLYICNNPKSDNYREYTGLCCEDDCEAGENDD